MRRYWDYTESERANLTIEQVEKLLAYELMERGVLQVEPLKLEEESPVALATRRVFLLREVDGYSREVLPIAFEDLQAAEAVRDRICLIRERDGWQGPYFTRPVSKLEIVAEDMPTKDAVLAAKIPLGESQRRAEANAKARREYDEASKKVSDATSGVWADWHECRQAEARRQKIRDTFADYVRMTEGDEELARAFLAKAFPAPEIETALPTPALPAEPLPA